MAGFLKKSALAGRWPRWRVYLHAGLAVALAVLTGGAWAAAYTLPAGIGSGPFSACVSGGGSTYNCSGNVSIGSNDTVNFSASMTLNVAGNFTVANNSNLNGGAYTVNIVAGGSITLGNSNVSAVNFTAGGSFVAGNTATINGDITAGGNVTIGNGGSVTGDILAGGSLSIGSGTTVAGSCVPSHAACSSSTPTPLAEYRFDECGQYGGAAGEVVDTRGAYPGTPMGGLQNATPGQIQRYADFSAASRYANLSSGPTLGSAWTIAAWFKKPFAGSGTHSNRYYVLGSVAGGGDVIFLDRNNSYRWGVYTINASDSTGSGGTTNGTFNFGTLADGWHHVVLVGSGNTTRLYVDGTYRDQVGRQLIGTFRYVGASYDGAGTSSGQSFGTPLDEFKIYAGAMDASQVSSLYANELAGNNHDGSVRPPACPVMTIANASLTEGNSGSANMNFTVSLSSVAASTVTATYALTDGTATGDASCAGGIDYDNDGGTVTIASGSSSGTIIVPVCGDLLYEGNETFTVTLSSPVGATLGSPSGATGTITNDDAAPTISIAAASTTEGDSGTKSLSFTVTQSAASGLATTATYALTNGTATGGGCGGTADFVNAGGTVTIAAGATSGTIDVPICGDTTYESDETLTVTLSSPSNATLGTPSSATGTIVNDDVDPDGCFLDTFTGADNSAPSSNWTTTTSSGSFGAPRIFGNRLRLTDNSASVSTAAHLQRMFPGAGNKIVVEFDHFAYNGTGADGIALTFSDAAVTPQAGAFGGSLGYAQKSNPGSDCTVVGGCPGFAGGWLGIGFDEYGNFSNATEGRIGGPGSRPDRVAIRGSGSGQSGYVYHTGSALLSPGIDQSGTTPGPGHRYRVTIDHTDGVQAKVSIERSTDGGSTYATIIPQYDAKVQTGQAAVPENWLLSYTGSTGASTNIHEIDNLKVCAVKPIVPIGPNHYVISHSGTGLTCEAEPVTFTAHDAGHSRANAGGRTLSISTSTSKGAWLTAADNCSSTCYNSVGGTVACAGTFTGTTGNNGQASYLFANGETGIRLCLKHNVATTVNINVSDGSASEATGSAAGEAPPGADPVLVFSDTGFRFYADGAVDAIGNLVAGLRSDVTDTTWQPSPQTIVIRALKSSETTPARCVSLLGSTAKTVQFGYECVDPNACHASSGGLEVNGAAVAGSTGAPTPASNVSVTFDGSGSGTINLKYWDVGQIKLYAQTSIADAASGDVSIVTGASNGFIVKPYGFDVRACTGSTPCTTANASATDGTGSVFAKAGEVFNATVKAVAYGGTVVTPSFGLGTGNATESVNLTPTLVAPSGAVGALGGTALPKRNAFTDGVANLSDLNWSEVGVMKINAANTLFQTVTSAATGASGNIGRFTPHHFGVTGTVVTRSDMQTSEGQVVPFTYMGEPMKLALVVTAYNKAEGVTQNYKGNFAKLDAGTLGTTVANWTCTSGTQCMGLGIVSGGNLSARLGIDTASANSAVPANTTTAGGATAGWEAGTSYFSLNMVVSRDTAADGPYRNLKFGAKPRDADGVTLPPRLSTDTAHCVNLDVGSGNENPACDPGATETNLRRKLFETDLRFGRLWLGNAYGSDQRGLAVPYETQYWNGFAFVRNADDGLTPFAVGNISRVTSLTTTLALTNLSAGRGTIDLGTPNGRGTVDVYVNLDSAGAPSNCGGHAEGTTVARSYLSGKWCGTAHDRDPVARATFGIQAGRKGPIYIRENY